MSMASKKPTNLSLDNLLLSEARALGVNLSQAAEAGLKKAVVDAKTKQWKEDNRAALDSSNDWADANGLPLEKFRQF